MFSAGQKIAFYCGGRGRGGHVVAFATVTKLNRKTVVLIEDACSYGSGTAWRCGMDWLKQNICVTYPGYSEGLTRVYGDLSR